MDKRLLFYAFVAVTIFSLSCNAKNEDNSTNKIVVQLIFPERQAKRFNGTYLYLVDQVTNRKIDSVILKGDTVVFNEKWDSSFVPYMVSAKRMDTSRGHPYLHMLGFKNPYKANTDNSLFYLDKGTTVMKTSFAIDSLDQSSFTGSRQNEPYLKNIGLQSTGDKATNGKSIIDRNTSIIKTYPYSVHLLIQLFRQKEEFTDSDLRNMLSCFDDTIQKTPMFKSFATYFAGSSSFDKAYPASITLEDDAGDYQKIGNDSAAYNLIVYWASWCKPCREEIPELKSLYEKFGQKGLAITSISFDEDKQNWQTALAQEKMPWQQLIAIDSTKTLIDLHYSIKAIPKMYLFDRKKQLLGTSENDYITPAFVNTLFENKQ